MMCRIASAFLLAATVWSSCANAEYRITRDLGGEIEVYKARFAALRDARERVVIDGACDSSCTLVLGIVPLSSICVTPRATLGFHMAYYDPEATDGARVVSYLKTSELMSSYPSGIKEWLSRNGGITKFSKYILGPELWSIVKPCSKRFG
jgi:hypothetical protein